MDRIADVVVIGGGIAGMVAAIESAKLGLDVHLVHDVSSDTAVRTITLGGVDGVDTGAETGDRGDRLDLLAQQLGVRTESLRNRHTLLDTGKVTAFIPDDCLAGVPGNPLANDVAPFVPRGRLRSYADRVMPFLRIGEPISLGRLVRARMGQAVLLGLTDPFTRAAFGLPASEVSIPRAAPKLNSTMTSLGTLSGAVRALSAEPRKSFRVEGGMQVLIDALRRTCDNYAIHIHEQRATQLAKRNNVWHTLTSTSTLRSHTVIAAVRPETLGHPALPQIDATARNVRIVTAHVEVAGTGTGATGLLRAGATDWSSTSHLSARSNQLASHLPPQHHLLRVVVESPDVDAEQAVQHACEALGLHDARLRDIDDWHTTVMRPWLGINDPEPGRIASEAGGTLEWTGQWVSGAGLSRVIAHAHDAAHRVRLVAAQLRTPPNS